MLQFLIISCLLSACFTAVGRAQDTSQAGSRPITTVTLQSTITVVPIAFTTPVVEYLPAPPEPTCDLGRVTCPACDGEDIDIDGGSTYKIHCDAALSSSTSVLQPAYITPNQCLLVCDGALDCVGTTLATNGSCVLSIGPDYRLSSSTGDIAFVQSQYVPSDSTGASNSSASNPLPSKFFSSATIPIVYPTSYTNASNTPALNLPKPYYTNFTLPNATHPVNTTVPANNTCSISNPTCPACNNQTLTDRHNVTYTVLCGYSLDATLGYASGEPLPAAYCMSRCDERNVTCLGASWSTEECVLALGPYVKVENPDHMAFIRAALPPAPYPAGSTTSLPRPPVSTGLSYLNMSRYDGGSVTTPTITATEPRGVPYTTFPPGISSDPLDPYCYYQSLSEGFVRVCQRTGVEGPTAVQPTITITDPALSTPSNSDPLCTIINGQLACALSVPGSTVETTASATDDKSTPTATPSQRPPQPYGGWAGYRGGPPPWAHGDYGVDEGSRHHKPQGSWWQEGRPPWSHWGWGRGER